MMILKVRSNYDAVWFGPARIRLSDDTEVLVDRANMSYIVTPDRAINGFDIEVQWSYLHFFDMGEKELPYLNFNGATLLEILPPDCPVPEDFWYRVESCFIDGEEVAVSAQPPIPSVTGKYIGITKDTAEEITGYLLRTEGKINPGKAYICPMVNIYSGEYDKEAEAYDNCFGPFVEVLPDSIVPAEGPLTVPDAKKLLEMSAEINRLKCEIVGYRLSESERLKSQIQARLLHEMKVVNEREKEEASKHADDPGAEPIELLVPDARILANRTIALKIKDLPLNLSQAKALYSYTAGEFLLEAITKQLFHPGRVCYSDDEIENAIYACAAELMHDQT